LPGRFVVARTSFTFALLLSIAFTAFVVRSSARESLRIKGAIPASTYSNDTVLVYGVGATSESHVATMLARSSGFITVLSNETDPWVDLDSNNLTVGSTVSGSVGDWQIAFWVSDVQPGLYVVYVSDSMSSDVVDFEVLMNVIPVSAATRGNSSN
jgi:roadblock/LC7 domain-containing protein